MISSSLSSLGIMGFVVVVVVVVVVVGMVFNSTGDIYGTSTVKSLKWADSTVEFNLVIKNSLPGDIDKDADVDIFDYNLLLQNFGNTICGNMADLNGDCKVDIFDYNILLENFGKKL